MSDHRTVHEPTTPGNHATIEPYNLVVVAEHRTVRLQAAGLQAEAEPGQDSLYTCDLTPGEAREVARQLLAEADLAELSFSLPVTGASYAAGVTAIYERRVLPLLRHTLMYCHTQSRYQDFYLDPISPSLDGYYIRNYVEIPFIRVHLENDGTVRVVTNPGQEMIVPLDSFNAARTREMVLSWLEKVRASHPE